MGVGTLEQFFAALGQMDNAQMFAGLGIALSQGIEGGNRRVIDKTQVAAVKGDLAWVIGRVKLVQEGRGRSEK